MAKSVSKLILKIGDFLVLSEKKAPDHPEKDSRLEFIGGGIKPGETPFQGLLRELEEEELTGFLKKRVLAAVPKPQQTMVNREPHYLYYLEIDPEEWKRLDYNRDESYGFKKIHWDMVFDNKKLLEHLSGFTPKTQAIFLSLKLTMDKNRFKAAPF